MKRKRQNEKKRKAEWQVSLANICPLCANPSTYKESQLLKELAKMKFDKEHKESLAKYSAMRERLQNLLEQSEKITLKQWKAEMQSLQAEYDSIGKEKSKTAAELAYAAVISYNKKNLGWELQNESRQHNKQQIRTKQREKELR